MRYIVVSILFSFFVFSCETKEDECKGNSFVKLNETDSVCLTLYTDIDTVQLKEIVTKAQCRVLLVFSAFTMPQKDILSAKNITNPTIKKLLQDVIIIKLNTDNKLKREESDSITIGYMNYSFQEKRFNSNTQPYHVFINKDLSTLGTPSSYMVNEKDVLSFLCQ